MKQIPIFLIVNLCFLIKQTYSQSSPCPDVFQYQSDGSRLVGIITIPAPGNGRTRMEAKIAIQGRIYASESGRIGLRKSLDAAVEDARRGRDIQYILNFPQSQQIPIILRLTLNNRDICVGPDVFASTWTFQHEFRYPSTANFFSRIPDRLANPPSLSNDSFEDPWLPRPTPSRNRPTTPPPPPPRPTTPPPPPPPPTRRTTPPPPPPPPVATPPPPAGPRDTSPARPSDGSWVASLPTAATCGKKGELMPELEATQLIIGGVPIKEAEFPWMVAMFHYVGRTPVYKCGGSLLSNTIIITAAHCTKDQERVYLELGRHNISNPAEKGYIARVSLEIYAHPDYTSGAHGDVALILIERVEFTPKIQPICLWALGTNLDNIVLRIGTVTGWGRLENDGDVSAIPMKLNIRTAPLETCRSSNELLRDIATDKTFCAGGENKGPCHGDSGSGFYIRHSDVFYLRGIISTSLGNDFVCNLSEYAVYVDLAYYLDWIRLYLTSL